MKYIENEGDYPIVELTRRNLNILLEKLDDPLSVRTIIDGEGRIAVRAVENEAHYADRQSGVMYMPTTNQIL